MSDWPDSGFGEPPIAFTPQPTSDTGERLARLRLIRSRRVGPATFLRLLSEHGSAKQALDALPDVARAAGVKDYAPCTVDLAEAEWRAARRAGAQMITLGDALYPATLAQTRDAPPILWAKGELGLLSRPMVALVGTRNASALGARMARGLSRDLGAAGLVVVSGLARGIDALAHRAALESGTIAVHAGGLDIIYPVENTELAEEIATSGLRISERPFGLHPRAQDFPRRNRIVSGLAQAVIVVEAATRSGSLITARCALDQGREVMAVPGHPLDTRSSGCNLLLRDGAAMVRSAADILETLGMTLTRPVPNAALAQDYPRHQTPRTQTQASPPAAPQSGGVEGLILSHLGASPIAEDQLTRDLGQTPREIAQALAILEMAGQVNRSAGGMVSRNR